MKVLVVDDQLANRKMMMMLVTALGHEVELAADGQIAVDMAKSTHYDLIFMDIHMPVLDGIQAIEQIRAVPGTPPRLVVVTADTTEESRLKALAVGADTVQTKPVDVAKLKRLLNFATP